MIRVLIDPFERKSLYHILPYIHEDIVDDFEQTYCDRAVSEFLQPTLPRIKDFDSYLSTWNVCPGCRLNWIRSETGCNYESGKAVYAFQLSRKTHKKVRDKHIHIVTPSLDGLNTPTFCGYLIRSDREDGRMLLPTIRSYWLLDDHPEDLYLICPDCQQNFNLFRGEQEVNHGTT